MPSSRRTRRSQRPQRRQREAINVAARATPTVALASERNPLKRWLRVLGPGLIAGASADDPSGIATYAVAGASFGFATLWTALITLPLMAAVQFTSAKIGMVTGRGLAVTARLAYPRALLYPLLLALVFANTLNAGADLGAIAAAINLLSGLPIALMTVPVALAILGLQVFLIMLIANNPLLMRDRRNGTALNVLGWTTAALMTLAAVVLVAFWATGRG